jgi:outer membrane immunogenic protein
MRKAIIAAAATLLGASAACAADIQDTSLKDSYERPFIDARWTGFYVGGQAGIAVGKAVDRDLSLPAPVITFGLTDTVHVQSTTMNGPVFGGYFGYNWQSGPLVYGLEASFSGADLEAAWTLMDTPIFGAVPFDTQHNITHEVDWFASATGRLGFAQGRIMFYGLGGIVWGNEDTTLTSSFFDLSSASERENAKRVGWTLGLGIEYALSERFSTRIEYSHVDFGNQQYFGGIEDNVDIGFDTIKLGASYEMSGDSGALPMQ